MDHGSPNLAENLRQCQRRIRELEQIVAQQQDVIAGYQEQLAQASEQLCLLKRALFGRRRERYAPSPDQLLLFTPEAVEGLSDEKATPAEEAPPITGRRRRRKGKRIVFPQFFERRRVDHPLPPDEVPCGCCGTPRTIIRTHVTAQLEMEQAKVYVLEHVRYTYACPDCREGSQVVTTEKPPQAVEKSPFGPSVLAGLVTWKFLHHLPLYRQQELLLGPMKQWLSRPLLCGLLRRTAVALRPLERLIRQQVLKGAVINADETPVKMLKPGHGRTVTGYVTGYAGDVDHRFVFYDFRVNRSRDGPEEMLASYRGYLQTDGYAVYSSLVNDSAGRLVDVACWAHGRRGFEEALHTTSDLLVHEALVWIQQLYDLEDRAREFTADERRALREEEAVPILERMKVRFLEVRPTLRPKSKLAAAVDYVLNRWEAFVRYTSDGRIPIDCLASLGTGISCCLG